jgi:hypothetical protein
MGKAKLASSSSLERVFNGYWTGTELFGRNSPDQPVPYTLTPLAKTLPSEESTGTNPEDPPVPYTLTPLAETLLSQAAH